jgi:hypothetical protein
LFWCKALLFSCKASLLMTKTPVAFHKLS